MARCLAVAISWTISVKLEVMRWLMGCRLGFLILLARTDHFADIGTMRSAVWLMGEKQGRGTIEGYAS